jgi:hypothetical protein
VYIAPDGTKFRTIVEAWVYMAILNAARIKALTTLLSA